MTRFDSHKQSCNFLFNIHFWFLFTTNTLLHLLVLFFSTSFSPALLSDEKITARWLMLFLFYENTISWTPVLFSERSSSWLWIAMYSVALKGWPVCVSVHVCVAIKVDNPISQPMLPVYLLYLCKPFLKHIPETLQECVSCSVLSQLFVPNWAFPSGEYPHPIEMWIQLNSISRQITPPWHVYHSTLTV